jgi:uncharacterized protein YlxP (DUF503 family)
MLVGVLHIELHIPHATGLKARRQVVQSIKTGLRNKFNVSVAEVDHQDLWQRAALAFACAGSDRATVDATLQRVFSIIDARTDCEVTAHRFEFR